MNEWANSMDRQPVVDDGQPGYSENGKMMIKTLDIETLNLKRGVHTESEKEMCIIERMLAVSEASNA